MEEIVKMVGMDALSPGDRLKMEAARSIREDFLHQNSFHEIDTYTSLKKQYMLMKLVNAFYDRAGDALSQWGFSEKIDFHAGEGTDRTLQIRAGGKS